MGDTVEATVEDYLDGMVLADAAATRRAFFPGAAIVGHEPAGFEWLSVEDFAAGCASAGPQPGGRAVYAQIIALETVGDIARVTLDDDYAGSRYTDYLTLLRRDGAWRIVNKTFFNHGPAPV